MEPSPRARPRENDTDAWAEELLVSRWRAMIERARPAQLVADPPRVARVATPEDTLLQKLRRYRLTDETSDRQWCDVAGIVRVSGPGLDREYLSRWARALGVEDLLERALREA